MSADNISRMLNVGLTESMQIVSEANANLLRVAMPGCITEYDSSTHKATVQPLIQYQKEGGVVRDLAPIADVPVIHPRSTAGGVFLPLAPGDPVTLLVSDRELGTWQAGSGQKVLPPLHRAHDMADCWAIPGGYPDGLAPEPRFPDAVEIFLKPGTPFAVGNGTDELIDLMDQLIDAILAITQPITPTTGPTLSPLINATDFIELKTKLSAFKA